MQVGMAQLPRQSQGVATLAMIATPPNHHPIGIVCRRKREDPQLTSRRPGNDRIHEAGVQPLPSPTTPLSDFLALSDFLLHTGSRAVRHRQRALSAAARRGQEAELARDA